MSKRVDPDVLVLKRCFAALDKSSSPRTLRANLEYLWDRLIVHPPAERVRKLGKGKLLSV